MLRLTVRHFYDFGEDRSRVGDDLVRPEAWDALRTQTDGPFAVARTRADAERTADAHPELEARAQAIDRWVRTQGITRLASYGVGGATLEHWLHRLHPELRLTLGEYAPRTVEAVRGLFPELRIERHDLLADAPLEAEAHLFHRIDTEFSTADFKRVLRRFEGRRILFVAAGCIGPREAFAELRKGLRPGASKAGWLRSESALRALWKPTHTAIPVPMPDLSAWALEPRHPG